MIRLGYSGRSKVSALKIAEASKGHIVAVRSDVDIDINWGRRVTQAELNPNIENGVFKRKMRELFKEHGVPMPKLIETHRGTVFNTNDNPLPWVGRPDQHMKGRGFWHINSYADFDRAKWGTRKKKAATHFMEYIEAPREYRVHIFLGKSIRISEKDHTAFHEYTTIKPSHNIKHVRRAAKQAVKAVGLDFGAVDILANDENCWVLEVNSSPGIGGSLPRLYAEKFEEWYERQ